MERKKLRNVVCIVAALFVLFVCGGLFYGYKPLNSAIKKLIKYDANKTKNSQKEENINIDFFNLTEDYFTADKCVNEENGTYKDVFLATGSIGLKPVVNSDKRSLTIQVEGAKYSKLRSELTGSTWTTENYEIKQSGFTKNIKGAYVLEIGQSAVDTLLAVVYEDGTMAYKKIFVNKTDSQGNTYYKASLDEDSKEQFVEYESVKNVVAIYNVRNYALKGYTSSATALAVKSDGKFFNLNAIFKVIDSQTTTSASDPINYDFSSGNCLNENDAIYEDVKDAANSIGLTPVVNGDKRSLTIKVEGSTYTKIVSELTGSTWTTENYEIKQSGFTKNIKGAYVLEIGQSVNDTSLAVVYEDGTVAYKRVFVSKKDGQGNSYYVVNLGDKDENSYTQINGVNGIVKIVNANNYHKVNSTGSSTSLAVRQDGKFYNLNAFVN